jgi:hypothetical protein
MQTNVTVVRDVKQQEQPPMPFTDRTMKRCWITLFRHVRCVAAWKNIFNGLGSFFFFGLPSFPCPDELPAFEPAL